VDEFLVGRADHRHRDVLANSIAKLRSLHDDITQLAESLGFSNDLPWADWTSLSAVLLEFRPTLIIELGRGLGASTALFQFWVNNGLASKVTSICQTRYWQDRTVPFLQGRSDLEWTRGLDAMVGEITAADYAHLMSGHDRIFVFWDAHGHAIADAVLGRLAPALPDTNLIVAHDMRDNRYFGSDSRAYDAKSLWRAQEETDSLWVHLGTVFSSFDQIVPIVDFCSRNRIEFHSATHSLALAQDGVVQNEQICYWHYFTPAVAPAPSTSRRPELSSLTRPRRRGRRLTSAMLRVRRRTGQDAGSRK
jgi:hypothetical protein